MNNNLLNNQNYILGKIEAENIKITTLITLFKIYFVIFTVLLFIIINFINNIFIFMLVLFGGMILLAYIYIRSIKSNSLKYIVIKKVYLVDYIFYKMKFKKYKIIKSNNIIFEDKYFILIIKNKYI